MNWTSWLLWGLIGTIALTSIEAGSLGLGLTRMNVPYLLGTIFTSNRNRAKLVGILLHFLMAGSFRSFTWPYSNRWEDPLGGWAV